MSFQCLRCDYPITEPICGSCIVNEVKTWVREQKMEESGTKKINESFRALLNQISSMDFVSLSSSVVWKFDIKRCLICTEEMYPMCSYCVIQQSSQIVKVHLRSKRQRENFQESFNIDMYTYEESLIANARFRKKHPGKNKDWAFKSMSDDQLQEE